MKKTKKKLTTFLIVLALLLLIIPTGALFADTIGLNTSEPSATTSTEIKADEESEETEEAKETEESEETEGTGEMSDRAVYIADRNAVAETLGIAPGRLNNIDKLAAAADAAGISGMTREELLADFEDASMQDIQREIKKLKNEAKHQK